MRLASSGGNARQQVCQAFTGYEASFPIMRTGDMRESIFPLHLCLHAAPLESRPVENIKHRGYSLSRWRLEPADQACELAVTFEDFINAVEKLPGSFVEWDGSFTWRPHGASGNWLEGNAIDGRQGLQNVEIKLHGPLPELTTLFDLLGWPGQGLAIQWVTEGLYLVADSAIDLVSIDPSSPQAEL